MSSGYIEKILGNKKFLDRGWPSRKLSRGADGLVSLADGEWKAHRNLVTPSYAPNVLENFIPTIIEYSQLMVNDFEASGGNFIEPIHILQNHMISIVLDTSMGLRNEVDHDTRLKMKKRLTDHLNSRFDRILRIHTWSDTITKLINWIYGVEDETENLRKHGMMIIEKRLERRAIRDEYDSTTSKRRNRAFLDNLLDAFVGREGGKGQKIDLEGLLSELLTIMATSYETIINTTLWFMYNMACNPSIQERLYQELADFDEKNEMMTISQINELQFMDQCVKENLRIHPPVCNMVRKTSEKVELDGYIVPKGTLTCTFIYCVHHDEKIYPDPDKFDPSRFEPQNLAKIPSGAYIPFGDGPRRCIGERLANLEAKIIFSSIIKRFRIVPFEAEKVRVTLDLLTRTTEPLKFRFIRREKVLT
ncbi:cytochrome P450 4c21-like [Brevipalpus obovatus]|uniref:cytochrome P450 4c21-like n=1 Tax=Brevipalpus obovatus TaxID=246614 RepID=UPI003D9E65E8